MIVKYVGLLDLILMLHLCDVVRKFLLTCLSSRENYLN